MSTGGFTGPVCHIPPVTTISTPPPRTIPAVPPPAEPTLKSLQHAVNTLREIIIIITGQQGYNNNQSIGSQPGGSFQQISVTHSTVRVYQDNDPKSPNFVDVQYVSQLKMGNNSTRSTWIYNAPAEPSS